MTDVRTPSDIPGNPPLPAWVTEFRDHQVEAINEIQEHYRRGAKVVFLDAPTGSGKTLIGEVTRRLQEEAAVYLCSSLTLQDQFLKDYPYARVLKGRSNYPTLDMPGEFQREGWTRITAADCTKSKSQIPACGTCHIKTADTRIHDSDDNDDQTDTYTHCDFCHPWQECPYESAKRDAVLAELAVINSTYFLTEANYVGRFGAQTNKSGDIVRWQHPFIVIDEADVLEQELMRFVEWSISERMMKQLDIPWPESKTVSEPVSGESWEQWARDKAQPKLKMEKDRLASDIWENRNMGGSTKELTKLLKRQRTVSSLHNRIKAIAPTLAENWVYTGYERPESKYAGVTFKPVKIDEFANDVLWKHGERFLLMSATIISPEQMALDLGLEDHEWAAVWVESGFPIENRPIYARPRARMTAKTKDESYPKMLDAVQQVLDAHPDERTLVHTVSYALNDYLYDGAIRRNPGRHIYSYSSSAVRARALQQYQENEGSVLFAPSFERGVDLPDELGRVVVVAKIPYPYLGDKQIKKRLYTFGGQGWYTMQTVRSIVQMSGRAMRHEDDQCSIYVLDGMFLKIWKESRHMIPKWWKDAIIWQP